MVDSPWFDLDDCKNEIDIALTDTVDDDILNDWGDKANRKIDNIIFPFKDDIPENSDITEDLKGAAVLYVAFRYKLKIKEFEAANLYKKEFNELFYGTPDDENPQGIIQDIRQHLRLVQRELQYQRRMLLNH